MEQLYSTTKAGALLGGLHQRDVQRLIHDGKLKARRQIVRGKGKCPRLYVPASEIDRYIKSLQWDDAAAEAEKPAEKPEPKRRGGGNLARDLAAATVYYD